MRCAIARAGRQLPRVSVSAANRNAGSPKPGDMIARNPENTTINGSLRHNTSRTTLRRQCRHALDGGVVGPRSLRVMPFQHRIKRIIHWSTVEFTSIHDEWGQAFYRMHRSVIATKRPRRRSAGAASRQTMTSGQRSC
jgi:hypothetical protein